MQARNVVRNFKECIKKAGVPDIRFHDLRHTHATYLLTKGVHPKVVQERLGHSSVVLTLDVYSHLVSGLQEAAASAFESFTEQLDGKLDGKKITPITGGCLGLTPCLYLAIARGHTAGSPYDYTFNRPPCFLSPLAVRFPHENKSWFRRTVAAKSTAECPVHAGSVMRS